MEKSEERALGLSHGSDVRLPGRETMLLFDVRPPVRPLGELFLAVRTGDLNLEVVGHGVGDEPVFAGSGVGAEVACPVFPAQTPDARHQLFVF